jgi:hypothetical protein
MKHLISWGLNKRIAMYMLDESEECAKQVEDVAVKLAVIGASAEIDPGINKSDPRLQKVRQSIPLLQTLIYSNAWKYSDAPQLEQAVEAAVSLSASIRPVYLRAIQSATGETL